MDELVFYWNRQWEVSDCTVTLKDPASSNPYSFDIDRVFETSVEDGRTVYDWLTHMARKPWVDISQFVRAFVQALRFQSEATGTPINEAMLLDSTIRAFEIASRKP